MPHLLRRATPLLLLLAVAAVACAPRGGPAPGAEVAPKARFAAALEASQPAVEAAIQKMDGFERRVLRDERAIAYALGQARLEEDATSPRAAAVTGVGAAEAAGEVLAPAFLALSAYGDRLGQALGAADAAGDTHPAPDPQALVAAAEAGLRQVRGAAVPAPIRQAGLAGIAALAATPVPGRPSPAAAAAMARAADPHLQAVAALLRAVLGADAGSGTRAAIRDRRLAMDRNHARLLAAVRQDRSVGPAGRYALFHAVTAMRDEDPAPGTLGGIAALVEAMATAHAGLAAEGGQGDAAERQLAAFEAALARLQALAGVEDEQD